MNFTTYFKQIKSNTINPISVFTGVETYLIQHTLEYILTHFLIEDFKSFNTNYFEGDLSVDELLEIGETLPFFDESRFLILKNTGCLKQLKEEDENKLIQFLKAIPPHLKIIFIENDIDGRKKIPKYLKKNGDWIDFEKLKGIDFFNWCKKKFQEYDGEIQAADLKYFIQRADYTDENLKITLYDIDQLIKTLCESKQTINQALINAYVKLPIEHNIFKLLDAVSTKQVKHALQILNDFIEMGEPPIKIFALLSQQYRNIYKVKHLIVSGYTSKTAAAKLSIHPFVAQKCAQFATSFTFEELDDILKTLVETDELLKSSNISAQYLIEKALFKRGDNKNTTNPM